MSFKVHVCIQKWSIYESNLTSGFKEFKCCVQPGSSNLTVNEFWKTRSICQIHNFLLQTTHWVAPTLLIFLMSYCLWTELQQIVAYLKVVSSETHKILKNTGLKYLKSSFYATKDLYIWRKVLQHSVYYSYLSRWY